MSLLRKLGVAAIIASLSFSQSHAHKATTRSEKSQVNAAHWEMMADIYHRALVQMHRELVELQRKCGTQFPVLPNYGAMSLESGKR
jgi:hypothetical protein